MYVFSWSQRLITFLVRLFERLLTLHMQTSGAKLFSSHGGAPIDRSLADDEDGLHEVHKAQKAAIPAAQPVFVMIL